MMCLVTLYLLQIQMDTTAIFSHLQETKPKENTVFLLSNQLYQTVAQVDFT